MKIRKDYNSPNNLNFDFLFPEDKVWFGSKEVSKILGTSDQYVRNCIHAGKILAHISTKNESEKNESEKNENKAYIRVHKQAIEIYLLETANYSNETFVEKITEMLKWRNDYDLVRISKIIKEQLVRSKNNRLMSTDRY